MIMEIYQNTYNHNLFFLIKISKEQNKYRYQNTIFMDNDSSDNQRLLIDSDLSYPIPSEQSSPIWGSKTLQKVSNFIVLCFSIFDNETQFMFMGL